MTTHIAGRQSLILEEIRSGKKTVEARLAKPRFKKFKPGDRIRLREDFWEKGEIVGSRMSGLETEVVRVELYPSFDEMLNHVDYKKVNARAKSKAEALKRIRSFYTPEQEDKLGVAAIHFKLISTDG